MLFSVNTSQNPVKSCMGAFHSTKTPVWNFGNFMRSMERYIPVAQTRPKHTYNYALKEKSKYCLYPKEHSTVSEGKKFLWIETIRFSECSNDSKQFLELYAGTAEGEGLVGPRPHHFFAPPPPLFANQILWFYSFFRFSIWKNYFQLSALPLFTLLRGPWYGNKFGVLANLYSARFCCIHFSLIDKLL